MHSVALRFSGSSMIRCNLRWDRIHSAESNASSQIHRYTKRDLAVTDKDNSTTYFLSKKGRNLSALPIQNNESQSFITGGTFYAKEKVLFP